MSLKSLKNKVHRRTGQRKPISKLWKPNKETAIRIRLIPGQYTHPDGTVEPIGFYVSHYHATARKFINCSSKWLPSATDEYGWDRKGKCLACYAKETGQLKNISTSRKYPATIVVCNNFHLDPIGYDGKPIGTDRDGNVIRRKVLCYNDPARCDGCKKGLETEWGRKMIWEIPETHLSELMAVQESYSKHCANCGLEPDPDTNEGGIQIDSVVCKICGHAMGPQYHLAAANEEKITCPQCGETGVPGILYTCPQCGNPKVPSLFDIDFTIKRDAGGMSLVVTKAKVKKPDSRILANPYFSEPMDLDKYYKPHNIEAQAAMLQIPNPWGDKPVQFKDYS